LRPKVYVTRKIPEAGIAILDALCEIDYRDEVSPPSRAEILKAVESVDAIYCTLNEKIDKEVMDSAKKLKVIGTMSVGVDHIDIQYATSKGIYVVHTPGVLTETVADHAWALLLATARRVAEADGFVRRGEWTIPWAPTMFLGYDVHGKTLGIIGLGRIGQAVARRAKGFNMKILYYDIVRREDLEKELDVEYKSLDEVLSESDFVTLHVPLTPQTEKLIGERELKMMKKTAVLVNTSRGKVIDEAALIKALREGWIAAAGLDVFEREPLPKDSPLIGLTNVVLTPHIGSASHDTRNRMAEYAAAGIITVLRGEIPENLYNKEVVKVRAPSELKML